MEQHSVSLELMGLQVRALAEEDPFYVPLLANVSALIYESMPDLSWAGFYLTEERKGETGAAKDPVSADHGQEGSAEDGAASEKLLVLGPFQGKPACIEIPWGKGVCGTAAAMQKTQLVPDVHAFPGHIACDAASRSEIVVPLFDAAGNAAGVLDIDSASPARFTEEDQAGLEACARILEEEIFARI